MKTRMILAFAVLALAAGYAQAQTLEGAHLRLVRPGQEFGGVLIGPNKAFPASTQNDTFYLPPGGGTLITSAAAGWQVGGQGLLPTNPGKLGSTDAADVSLIAGGVNNVRMTLLSGSAAVLLPTETELRLGDQAGGHYSAIKSPADIEPTPGNDGSITYILPSTLPGGLDVRLQVENIVGNTVYLGYTNPNATGQIGFNGSGAQTCSADGVNFTDVTGISFVVDASAIYSFEVFLDVAAGCDADITFGSTATDTDPAGVTVRYKVFNLTANGNDIGGGQEGNTKTLQGGEISLLKGYIQTTAATPAASVVTVRVKKGCGGAGSACITAKSAIQLVTE